jgi:hypothetical protein
MPDLSAHSGERASHPSLGGKEDTVWKNEFPLSWESASCTESGLAWGNPQVPLNPLKPTEGLNGPPRHLSPLCRSEPWQAPRSRRGHGELLAAREPWVRIRLDDIHLALAGYAHVNAAIIAKLDGAIGLDRDLGEPGYGFFIEVFGNGRFRQLAYVELGDPAFLAAAHSFSPAAGRHSR